MNCKICAHPSKPIFEKKVLLKYPVKYFQCQNCGFVQTEEVFWLKEAYENAITSLDIGLLKRNNDLLPVIVKFIDTFYPESETYLDYAGGYGIFTRLMRDLGYDFYTYDIYCENIFAKHFDISDAKLEKFDVATAFEVFEHLDKPLEEISDIFNFSEDLIFSTEILPKDISQIENWMYIAPETGQHIAFYTEKSLKIIADKFEKHYHPRGNLHIFSSKALPKEKIDYAFHNIHKQKKFFGIIKEKIDYKINRESLLQKDYQKIQKILEQNSMGNKN